MHSSLWMNWSGSSPLVRGAVHEVGRVAQAHGSSPRVRGAGSKVLHNAHIIGIIPACAGSSCAHASTFLFGWDHPRACGEQVNKEREEMTSQGSSPRMRGTGRIHDYGPRVAGIIPAHAGNSSSSR